MEDVLRDIIVKRTVTNGTETVPLNSAIDAEEGAVIQRVIGKVRPETYLEVGLAFGVSALFAGEALRGLGRPYSHHILDPNQYSEWKGIGVHNMRRAGLWDAVTFHEESSEFALPRLAQSGLRIDMAFIDGWHTFDHTLIDFFYINRMLRVGGAVVFDDAHFPAVSKVIRHALSYPAYRRLDRTTPMWRSTDLKEVARRQYHLVRKGRINLTSSCVALVKVAEDRRDWDWHRPF